MKDYIKFARMSVVALLIAIIGYPFMHESGHSLASVFMGAQVAEFNLLPIPNILCNVTGLSDAAQIIIGLSGIGLPFLFSAVMRSKRFALWFSFLVFKGITVLSMAISAVITVMYMTGARVENDDITQVLDLWSGGAIWILIGTVLCAGILIIQTAREHPLRRIVNEFEQDEKRECAV